MTKFKQTHNPFWGQLDGQLGRQLWGQLNGQLWGQLWGQLGEFKPSKEQKDKAYNLLKETE